MYFRDVGDSTTNTMEVIEQMDLLPVSTAEDISLVREVCELMSQRGAYVIATGIVCIFHSDRNCLPYHYENMPIQIY